MNPLVIIAQKAALVETFPLAPTDHGSLDGLCCAVKALIDIAVYKTSCGNPTRRIRTRLRP